MGGNIRTTDKTTPSTSPTILTYYLDWDRDDYGDIAEDFEEGKQTENYTLVDGDCDDNNFDVNPGVSEICGNGVDDNCEDGIDEGCDTVGYFYEGAGSLPSPYVIYNCYQLENVSYDLSAYYELGDNIDCSMTTSWDEGAGFAPIGESGSPFNGEFDGGAFYIDGLFIDRSGEDYISLFGYVDSGEIINVGMIGSDITGNNYVGGIVGHGGDVRISYNTGSVSGNNYVGGISGDKTKIYDSYNTGSIIGNEYVGGIVGFAASSLNGAYNIGLVEGASKGGITANYGYMSIGPSSFYLDSSCVGCYSYGMPRSSQQMMLSSGYGTVSFVYVWNFADTWNIEEGVSYPYLRGNEQIPHPSL